jgi:hypothetical protein
MPETTTISVPKDKATELQKLAKLNPESLRILASKIDKYGANLPQLENKLKTFAPMI